MPFLAWRRIYDTIMIFDVDGMHVVYVYLSLRKNSHRVKNYYMEIVNDRCYRCGHIQRAPHRIFFEVWYWGNTLAMMNHSHYYLLHVELRLMICVVSIVISFFLLLSLFCYVAINLSNDAVD